MPRLRIITLYWSNIPTAIVRLQAEVFRHLERPIEQVERTGMKHGDFLDNTMRDAAPDDVILFVDIDCIPTNREIIDHAHHVAETGGIFGCAQSAEAFGYRRIYTGPMFMAISRRTWDDIGQPSFNATSSSDVGQAVHDRAQEEGVSIEYIYPWACAIPKWNLADRAVFGIGTFYGGGVFHLFESRVRNYAFLFQNVAQDVIANRPIDPILHATAAIKRFALIRVKTRLLWIRDRQRARLARMLRH